MAAPPRLPTLGEAMEDGRDEPIEPRVAAAQHQTASSDDGVEPAEAACLLQETSCRVTILLGGALTVTTMLAFAHLAAQA